MADTDPQIRVGPGYPDPEIRGAGLKNFFSKNEKNLNSNLKI